MMDIIYLPSFVRQYKNLEKGLQDEVIEKIELFKNKENHKQLKLHKLHGPLKDRWSFSVNYKIRIVCIFESKNKVAFLSIGDHKVYE